MDEDPQLDRDLTTLAAHRLLGALSDNPRQCDSGHDPMEALFRQAERAAAKGDDGGALTWPF